MEAQPNPRIDPDAQRDTRGKKSMTTTALIVEMIVIGLQVAIWLSMAVSLAWRPDEQTIKWLAAPLTLVSIGLCYSVGLVVDAFTACLENRWTASDISKEDQAARILMRQRLRLTNRDLFSDLDKDQYLLRLLRSTAFNICFIAAFGSLLALDGFRRCEIKSWLCVVALVTFAIIGCQSWWRQRKKFNRARDAFYQVLKDHQSGLSPARAPPNNSIEPTP